MQKLFFDNFLNLLWFLYNDYGFNSDEILNDNIQFVINTPLGSKSRYDEEAIGKTSVMKNILTITTMSGARAAIEAISLSEKIKVKALQEYFK